MATLRELIIKISANSQSFQSEITRASRMGSDYYKTMQNGGRQAAAAARESQRAIAELNSQLVSVKASLSGISGAIAGAFAVTSLITVADTWGQVASRLKMATTSADEYVMVQKRLMETSDRTYKPIEEQAELYIRSSTAMKELGYSTESTINFIDSISSALTINAATADKAGSAVNALSKSMVQGKISGDDWHTVMEVLPTVIGDVARYLGTTETAVKKLAASGKLSMQTFSDAVIAAQKRNADLAESMPNTVGDALTKLSNHWKTYISDANSASGATAVVSATISDLANNIDTLAKAGGILVGIGAARYFGGMASGAISATGGLIGAAKSEVALSEAQLRGTQIATARARADVYRAQQSLAAARNTDAQAAAEKRLSAAQSVLTSNINARAAAQNTLNNVTSMGSRLMSGALGLIGGIPGLIMLGAGAWYYMYQQQEQARQSARDYAKTIDEIKSKTSTLTLSEASDSEGKTRLALNEQNRLVSEQQERVRKLKNEIAGYQMILANPGPSIGGYLINHLISLDDATKGLADSTSSLFVEQERLAQMQSKSEQIQNVLEGLEHRRVALIRQQAAEQNSAYQSLLMMNGQHTEFNRLLSLGNNLLASRQQFANVPLRLPVAELNEKQSDLMQKSSRALELSKLTGAAKARRQAEFDADDAGLSNTPQYAESRNRYIENQVGAFSNNESQKKQPKGPKTEGEKQEDVYKRLLKQQKEQIAMEGQTTELAKIKAKIQTDELSTLSNVQKQTLLRNAALIDQQKETQRLKTFTDQLADSNAAAKNKSDTDFIGAGQGDRAREQLREMADIRINFAKQQSDLQREFNKGDISENLYKLETEALRAALDERLAIQEDYYKKSETQRGSWSDGAMDSVRNYVDSATNYNQQAADAMASVLSSTTSSLADGLKGIATNSKSVGDAFVALGSTLENAVLDALAKIAAQWLINQALQLALGTSSTAASIAMATTTAAAWAPAAAMASLASFGANAAPAAAALASTSALASGLSLVGMAHDGIDSVPETGTWLLQKGERVTTAKTSAKLDETLSKVANGSTGGPAYSPTINIPINGNPSDATIELTRRAAEEGAIQGYRKAVNSVMSGTGDLHKAMTTKLNTGRRVG